MAHKNSCDTDKWQAEKDEIIAFLPSLKAFAVSLTRNPALADDLVQETIVRAFSHIDQFQKGTQLKAWLFTILRNTSRTNYRKRRREVEWDPFFDNALFVSTGLGNAAEDASELERVLMCMACLPAEQSDALMATGYLGLEYGEAGERLGCPKGTIKSRVNRARNAIAGMLSGTDLISVDLSHLQTATRGIPKTHPFYPIARAYEDLYAHVRSTATEKKSPIVNSASKSEALWQGLVSTGALDDWYAEMPEFIEQGFDGR